MVALTLQIWVSVFSFIVELKRNESNSLTIQLSKVRAKNTILIKFYQLSFVLIFKWKLIPFSIRLWKHKVLNTSVLGASAAKWKASKAKRQEGPRRTSSGASSTTSCCVYIHIVNRRFFPKFYENGIC